MKFEPHDHAFNKAQAGRLLRYASIDPGSDYRGNVAKTHKAQQRAVQSWIEAGQRNGSIDAKVRPALVAELFCAAMDGLLYRWLVDPSIPIDELHEQLHREVRHSFRDSVRHC